MSVKRMMQANGGFTLVEMTVVIAIISVLAALALPAVTGVTTDTRGSSKAGDQKQVQQAVVRYGDAEGGLYPSDGEHDSIGNFSVIVQDMDHDGTIKIAVDSQTTGTNGNFPGDTDATCGTNGQTLTAALDRCFGPIHFSALVPEYMSSSPQHAFQDVDPTVTSGTGIGDNDRSTADFTITNCDLAGSDCEFYLEEGDDLRATDVLKVWNLNGNGSVFTFKEDTQYGK